MNYLYSTIETIQNLKCSTIFELFMSHIWDVQDLDDLNKSCWQTWKSNPPIRFMLSFMPVGKIRQISYICLLEKNFGKPQLFSLVYSHHSKEKSQNKYGTQNVISYLAKGEKSRCYNKGLWSHPVWKIPNVMYIKPFQPQT